MQIFSAVGAICKRRHRKQVTYKWGACLLGHPEAVVCQSWQQDLATHITRYVCISTYDACKQPPSVSAANQKEKQANSPKEWKRKPSEREMAVNCAGGNQSWTHPQIYKKVYTQLVLPRSLLPPLLCLGRPGSLSYCPRSPPPTTSAPLLVGTRCSGSLLR